jgi:hypothetical protein
MEALPSTVTGPTLISRFTAEVLHPVPVGEVSVTARLVRGGRSVELLEAKLEAQLAAGGRTAMLARAWRIRRADLELPAPAVDGAGPGWPGFPARPFELPPVPPPRQAPWPAIWQVGYAAAMDWRFVAGRPEGGQPALVWARPLQPLVAGEPLSPAGRVVLLADTGNGLSRVLDVDTWWFISTDLTVHLHREPVGDWVLLAARSTVEPHGVGMTETQLFDRDGPVGRAAQALLVGPR